MATITLRLTDQKAKRLKQMAEKMNVSVNKLLDEMTTVAITHDEVQTRFAMRAARGSSERGLATLDKLDAYFVDDRANARTNMSVHELPQTTLDDD